MAKDTKKRILEAALEMFSQKGYAGTNIRELAESLGLAKSALYRHFESKEELWRAVHDMMIDYYGSHFGSADRLPAIPGSMRELTELTGRMVDFTVHDGKVVMMRKILLTEQFRDERVRDLATHYFLYGTEAIFTGIFTGMMANGSMKQDDPQMLAFAYTAPITALIHLCDREPDREAEAMERMKRFTEHFAAQYGTGN